MGDEAYRRYVNINLPHSRTIVARLGRTLEALGAMPGEDGEDPMGLRSAYEVLEQAVRDFDEDPPIGEALRAADALADHGRALVDAIKATECRNDRLGQWVRNLFECLGFPEEGAHLALLCGERSDSPLR